ncbi:F0F1 ATP synthase subunit delta [Rathayibacter soli]|uniref:F0F1 ATP synthase subunit delta n=1 Tax=Rathayibacter soli TaxID=3144168 RepID=UPI0027E482E8|nr:F0F1 ATP synthase subunit delta [Glaciibacter superstes]
MGSATVQALAASRQALASLGSGADLATARELFAAERVLGESAQLRALLADPSAGNDAKADVLARVFGAHVSAQTLSLLSAIATHRWSNQNDLLAGIEEIGIRAIAQSTPAQVPLDDELLAFGHTVTGNAELELALRSKLASPDSKAELVQRLLQGKASEQTIALVRQLVSQPRGRSIRIALRQTAAIIADQSGLSIATVTSARPLSANQRDRLIAGLSVQYDRELRINEVIDPALIGGLRVQIGNDVIDSSIATRINDVKLQLAG